MHFFIATSKKRGAAVTEDAAKTIAMIMMARMIAIVVMENVQMSVEKSATAKNITTNPSSCTLMA